MLLLGASVSMIYAGLDQGNRLDWLESGTVMALLIGGGVLFIGFLINETLVRQPWAHVNVLFSRNIGLSLVVILLYTLTSLSNSSLVPNFLIVVASMRPEQIGRAAADLRCTADFRAGADLDLPAPAFRSARRRRARLFGVRGRQPAGHAIEPRLGARTISSASCCCNRSARPSRCCRSSYWCCPTSDPSRATAIAAYIQIMRLGGAEIGVALMGTWLRVREQIHSNYLGLHIENGSFDVTRLLKQLGEYFASHGVGAAPARALGTLAARVQREANVLAYIDGFWLCFWLAMAALFCVALITRAPPGPFTPEPFGFAKNVLRKCGVTVS